MKIELAEALELHSDDKFAELQREEEKDLEEEDIKSVECLDLGYLVAELRQRRYNQSQKSRFLEKSIC